eukprot:3028371-Prymnesium_polylepis.1
MASGYAPPKMVDTPQKLKVSGGSAPPQKVDASVKLKPPQPSLSADVGQTQGRLHLCPPRRVRY